MAIDPNQAADARHSYVKRLIRSIEAAIDEMLRLNWRGPGRKIVIRESGIKKLSEIKEDFSFRVKEIVCNDYNKAGWSVEIEESLADPRWIFQSPSNLNVSEDLVF